MKKNKHIIEKVFLEINTNSMKVANSLKNNSNMFIQNELLQLIEKELNGFSINENEILQIEKLTISVTNDNFKNDSLSNLSFNDGFFKSEIENQIRQKIAAIINKSKINPNSNRDTKENLFPENQLINTSEKKSNTLLYYLIYGELPWWVMSQTKINSQLDNIFNIEDIQESINSKNFIPKFKTIIEKNIVRQRLINQFSNEQLALIVSGFESIKLEKHSEAIQKNKLIHFLNKINDFEIKKSFWETIFSYIKDSNPKNIVFFYYKNNILFEKSKWPFETFINKMKEFITFNHEIKNLLNILKEQNLFKEEIKNSNIKKEEIKNNNIKKEASKIPIKSNDKIEPQEIDIDNHDKKTFYIQTAGLILLHPFIKELFKSCQLIKKGNIIEDKELATHLLHYVATKKEYDYEHNMLFEKFLCGLPLHYPIKREILIPEAYKTEVEEMLTSAVSHWDGLKSSSTALLRNEFLQREGKLDIQDSNPKIYIVRKTQDILLDKIPWNISIVKIPWIEKLIYTEW